MTFKNGVILDVATYNPNEINVAALSGFADAWTHYDYTSEDEVLARIDGADVVITNKVVFGAAEFAAAKNLKLLVVGATGVNNIDLETARGAGITICNVAGYSTQSVAQHVFAFMLMHVTSMTRYDGDVKSGKWQAAQSFTFLDHPLSELNDKTIGIIGLGDIGAKVKVIAEAFGMNVMISERKGVQSLRDGRDSFDDVLVQSDFITLHCPLTDETRDMIAAAEFQAMKDTAFLVNCARGGVVHEGDLAKALRAGDIAGAGVDVLSQEPPRNGNPLLDGDVPNLIISPHTAWASQEARQRLFDQIGDVMRAFLNNKPINVVS